MCTACSNIYLHVVFVSSIWLSELCSLCHCTVLSGRLSNGHRPCSLWGTNWSSVFSYVVVSFKRLILVEVIPLCCTDCYGVLTQLCADNCEERLWNTLQHSKLVFMIWWSKHCEETYMCVCVYIYIYIYVCMYIKLGTSFALRHHRPWTPDSNLMISELEWFIYMNIQSKTKERHVAT
jgi:hypothetical protein